jgi:hypothetical protein
MKRLGVPRSAAIPCVMACSPIADVRLGEGDRTATGVSAGATEAESFLMPTPSVPDTLLALDLTDMALNVVTPAQWRTIQEQPEKGESRGRSDVLNVFT